MALGPLWSRLQKWEKNYRERFSHDIVNIEERKKSQFYMSWIDHEVLRVLWHNFDEIAPNVYRANQPTRARIVKYAAMGIKTVLNLRGASRLCSYKFEVESCNALGLELIDIPLSARQAPPKERLLQVISLFPTLEKPILIHCKSGADRTGLVAVLYLISIEHKSVKKAMKQLTFKFLHLKFTKTGIMDYIFFIYEKRLQQGSISFVEWVETEYDSAELTNGFAKVSFWRRFAL